MSGTPRVLCIAGSPRRHGNSDRLLDELARGVSEAGGEPIRLVAADARVFPCRGCNACSATGTCVITDGMDEVYRLIDSVDAVVVGTPVYFATVPAVLKTLYDRCQPYWARRYVLREPPPARRRPGAALIVGGGGDPFGTQCALTPTRSVMNVLGVSLDHVLEVVGPDDSGDIARFAAELEQAALIGREITVAAHGSDAAE